MYETIIKDELTAIEAEKYKMIDLEKKLENDLVQVKNRIEQLQGMAVGIGSLQQKFQVEDIKLATEKAKEKSEVKKKVKNLMKKIPVPSSDDIPDASEKYEADERIKEETSKKKKKTGMFG